jgi:adenosylcobinamide kinase/adenosylcobinamide-phosphate guanylyltransferase
MLNTGTEGLNMAKDPKIIFMTGGARSGKSSFALREAEKIEGGKLFVATAEALDGEMKKRIQMHKDERGQDWQTVEEPLDIINVLQRLDSRYDVVLIDCLTLWLSNVITRQDIDGEVPRSESESQRNTEDYARIAGPEIDKLTNALKELKRSDLDLPSNIIIVSNEVGMSIVPDSKLARAFRDIAGGMNQKIADISDEVYLVVSGIPVKIKG